MALDSYRVSETKKVTEKPKTLEEIKKEQESQVAILKRMINELPRKREADIDQQWIKENESKEFSFSSSSQKKDDNEIYSERMDNQLQSIASQPEETISPVSTTDSEIEKDILPDSEPSIDNLTMDTINEEHSQESIVTENSELIEELNVKINKKYDRLIIELSNLYNSETINQEAHVIMSDLQNLMETKEDSLESLKKVYNELNNLISRFAKLSQKADELKASDDFKINEQIKQMHFLEDYQSNLQSRYGNYWFGKMTEQEKEQYITLYVSAHKVSRKTVQNLIENSIEKAYNEIIANAEQKKQQSQNVVTEKPQPFRGNYENLISFNGRQALETLKQIYSNLGSANQDQVTEFGNLYSSLSNLSKMSPTNYEEEQQKLTQLYDLSDRIDQLQSSLSESNDKSK